MAAHVRKQIRDHVVTTLTGLATTGGRVYTHRRYPLGRGELPGLLVYTMSENVVTETMGVPRRLNRDLQLGIEVVASDDEGTLDDTLDQICKEVETALATDPLRAGLALDTRLEGVEITVASGDGQMPIGKAAMSWIIPYGTRETIPDVPA